MQHETEIEKFYAQVEDIDTCMMVTRRTDGHLRSRAMANQRRASGADLWFVTAEGSAKLADLAHDPHINLSYYRDANKEWISVSGTATVSRDRQISASSTRPTGRSGSRRMTAIHAMARQTTRAWC